MFMADFSHELKTPLTAISGYAQTMLKLRLSEEECVEALSYIHSESNRLDRLSRKMKRLLELDNTVQLQMEKIAVFDLFAAAVVQYLILQNGGFESELYRMSVPLVCTFPYTCAWLSEYKSGFTKLALLRTTVTGYIFGKYFACIAAGGLSELLSSVIYTAEKSLFIIQIKWGMNARMCKNFP